MKTRLRCTIKCFHDCRFKMSFSNTHLCIFHTPIFHFSHWSFSLHLFSKKKLHIFFHPNQEKLLTLKSFERGKHDVTRHFKFVSLFGDISFYAYWVSYHWPCFVISRTQYTRKWFKSVEILNKWTLFKFLSFIKQKVKGNRYHRDSPFRFKELCDIHIKIRFQYFFHKNRSQSSLSIIISNLNMQAKKQGLLRSLFLLFFQLRYHELATIFIICFFHDIN